MAAMDYVNELKNQRDKLADILAEKGLQATRDETFNTLITKVKDIGGSEYEGTILNVPFLPKNLENFSVGIAEEFEITEE
ncbi:MAG: hypothetical protein ACI4JD_00205 [Ruminococcus sp.]